jgi:hypothetical protein
MSKTDERDADMRAEYDFSGGVRGKYAERYAQGTNVVVLEALREQLRQREPASGSGR